MVYLVTNITDVTIDPKTIYLGDIPNAGTIPIEPGETVDLETYSTRNQILDSRMLRVHFGEGRVTIDTLGSPPRDRIYVDATISDIVVESVDINAWPAIDVLVNGIETAVTGVTVDGHTYIDVNELLPSQPTIQTLAIPTANAEYVATLPIDSKRFLVKVRTSDATVNLAFTSGGDYVTIREGVAFSEEEVDAGSINLYLTLDKAPRIVEILSWA